MRSKKRSWATLALAPVFLVGLAGALTSASSVAGALGGAAPSPLTGTSSFFGFNGEVAPYSPVHLYLDCPAVFPDPRLPYVEGDADSGYTVVRRAITPEPGVTYVVVADHTDPYKFGTRITTSANIIITNFSLDTQSYHLVLWCTDNKDQAWRVFG